MTVYADKREKKAKMRYNKKANMRLSDSFEYIIQESKLESINYLFFCLTKNYSEKTSQIFLLFFWKFEMIAKNIRLISSI